MGTLGKERKSQRGERKLSFPRILSSLSLRPSILLFVLGRTDIRDRDPQLSRRFLIHSLAAIIGNIGPFFSPGAVEATGFITEYFALFYFGGPH
jgi:hypothetical protein